MDWEDYPCIDHTGPRGLQKRPSFDEYFLGIAKAVSARGDCTRSQVGAVIVDKQTKQIIATGYNGTDPGAVGCIDGGCPRGQMSKTECPPYSDYSNCIALHAEENALHYALKNQGFENYTEANYFVQVHGEPKPLAGAVIYTTRYPCSRCQMFFMSMGIHEFYWRNEDGSTSSGLY